MNSPAPPSFPSGAFSRQVILPGVGEEGQGRWASSHLALAGEGPSREGAASALTRSGVGKVSLLEEGSLELPPDPSLVLVLTGRDPWRRALNRTLRAAGLPALFAWSGSAGPSFFFYRPSGGACPCLECFQASNPKAFASGPPSPSGELGLGALAASESMMWVLKGDRGLTGKVLVLSRSQGLTVAFQAGPSDNCPAAAASGPSLGAAR